jgi:protein-tyrosine phosphatase
MIEITRTDSGTLKLQRTDDHPFKAAVIYAGTHPDTIDRSTPVARVTDAETVLIRDLDLSHRHFFEVHQDGQKPVMVAERSVPLEGMPNFRDLGGYLTEDGRRVRWGRVYRSGVLARLTPDDLTTLERLGIKLICDLRSQAEVDDQPTLLKAGAVQHLPIQDKQVDASTIRQKLERGDLSGLDVNTMSESYKRLLGRFGATFGRVMRLLADPENLPAVFHCSAGKDRTGLSAMFLLTILGVPRETITRDYDLTNALTAPMREHVYAQLRENGIDPTPLAAIFGAPVTLLETAYTYLDDQYGGPLAYLRSEGGVDDSTIEALRTHLLD